MYERVANFTDSFISNSFHNSWAWTLDVARNKKYGAFRRVSGVALGTVATATTGVANVGVKVTRKGVDVFRKIKKGFSKAMKEYGESK
jgi:hypothetical protein